VVLFMWRSVLIHRGLCILNWAFVYKAKKENKKRCLYLSAPLSSSFSRPHQKSVPHSLVSLGYLVLLSLIYIMVA
jgi:hypothetical protein